MRKSITLMLSMLMFGIGVSPTLNAQVEEVVIAVDGMACPFCAYGLEKKLKKIEGVSKVKINIDKGIATLTNKEGESISVERLNDVVDDAGFTPRQIPARVVGTVENHGGTLVLRNRSSDFMFILKKNDQLQKLRKEIENSKNQIRVEGLLAYVVPQEHHGHPYTLTVERFEVIP